ncbi:synaptotagmin-4-like [Tripterygium wilfordii]|uniref:synaptotagmin-4-like n=1 Tax=Tripterygium wilfordii TaxID=458696 RepID=UPI0018F81897|nr:synaptotagmin-4-like [Tripterygium wilfordii]
MSWHSSVLGQFGEDDEQEGLKQDCDADIQTPTSLNHLRLLNFKLKWLNLHLIKILPYMNEATSKLIKASVEPVLEQDRAYVLSSLKFSKFTLGYVLRCES